MKKSTLTLCGMAAVLALAACKSPSGAQTVATGQSTDSGACRFVRADTSGKGKNEAYMCSASAALRSAEAKEVLNPDIRVSYGTAGGNLTSRQVANARGKTAEETCQRAFLSTIKRFQTTAAQQGSKHIRVSSYFDKRTVGGDRYECHIGTWNSRVVLRGGV